MSTRDLARILIPIFIIIIIITIGAIFIYNPPTGNLVCKLSSAPGDPHAEYTYTVTFKYWNVKTIETKEVITSDNKEVLKKFEQEEKTAQKENELAKDYHKEISLKGKKLKSITTVQYKKLKIKKIKKMYQKLGAKCKYQ